MTKGFLNEQLQGRLLERRAQAVLAAQECVALAHALALAHPQLRDDFAEFFELLLQCLSLVYFLFKISTLIRSKI